MFCVSDQGVAEVRDLNKVRELAAKVEIPPFQEKRMQIIIEETDPTQQQQQQPARLHSQIQASANEEAEMLDKLKEELLNISALLLLLLLLLYCCFCCCFPAVCLLGCCCVACWCWRREVAVFMNASLSLRQKKEFRMKLGT